MAELQKQFNKFHETIKIDFDGNKPLRDKRDMILKELRAGLKKKYPTNTPTFESFNQGSYDMSTGVEPIKDDDYDIDIGIVFNLTRKDVEPVKLKKIVHDILNSAYQRKVEMKRPCVRVQYQRAGAKIYHVDLAIYSYGESFLGNRNDTLYIAKGFLGSSVEKRFWEVSEPYLLKELIKTKFSDNASREQFRRVIRYLKRWKDYNFSSSGSAKPTGIALTALCYNHFEINQYFSKNSNTVFFDLRYNDLQALLEITCKIISQFTWSNEISVQLPVRPYNDLFEKMTPNQMLKFKQKLEALKTTLENATSDTQVTKACMRLRSVFGGDFPKS